MALHNECKKKEKKNKECTSAPVFQWINTAVVSMIDASRSKALTVHPKKIFSRYTYRL
jgi:hypothetical protein